MSIQSTELDIFDLINETEDASCGALVVFGGTVRNHHDAQSVDRLSYSAHEIMATRSIQQVEIETQEKFDVPQCRIQHRIGDLEIGDLAVVAVVRAAHRDAAFEAARYAIDEVKKRAEIWKEEHYSNGQSRFRDGTSLNTPEPSN